MPREDCGTWCSYFDGMTATDASTLAIGHMISLAEAWDSGAAQWAAQ